MGDRSLQMKTLKVVSSRDSRWYDIFVCEMKFTGALEKIDIPNLSLMLERYFSNQGGVPVAIVYLKSDGSTLKFEKWVRKPS